MRNLLKLSALAAVLVVSATYASASTINFVSGAGSSVSDSNGNLAFLGYNATEGTAYPGSLTYAVTGSNVTGPATSTTVAIGTGVGTQVGVWGGPIGSSSWVSFDDSEPGSNIVPNDGDYVYETTIDTTGLGSGQLVGTLNILADDTVSVFVNGTVVSDEDETAQGVGTDNDCSAGVPSCVGSIGTQVTLTGLVSGVNTIYFVVEQTGLDAEGLDFTGSISTVPEPSSLLMLGTGLVGSAGALFRRMRSK